MHTLLTFATSVMPSAPTYLVTLTLSVLSLPHLRLLPEGMGHIHAVSQDSFLPDVGYYERSGDVVELTADLQGDCRYVDEYGRLILDWLPESSRYPHDT